MKQFITELFHGRMLGHPIHLMLNHFPSALFPAGFLFDLLGSALNERSFAFAGFCAVGLGLLGGLGAAVFGFIDYLRVPASSPAWNKASLHALLNLIWMVVFGVIFGIRAKYYPQIEIASVITLLVMAVATVGLLFSNYLGGDLVVKHHLGIREASETK